MISPQNHGKYKVLFLASIVFGVVCYTKDTGDETGTVVCSRML